MSRFLEERRHKNRASMFFKILYSLVAIPKTQLLPTSRETRGNSTKFHQLPTSQVYYTNTFLPSALKIWNSLPSTFSSITDLDIFKECLNSISVTALLANPYSRTSRAWLSSFHIWTFRWIYLYLRDGHLFCYFI